MKGFFRSRMLRSSEKPKPKSRALTTSTEGIIHVPLSEIGIVWSVKDGDWCLRLKGQIQNLGDAPFYVPNA